MKDLERYSDWGVIVGVCTSLPLDEAKARMGAGWTYSESSMFRHERQRDGSVINPPNGSPCPDAPESRTHYLFRIAVMP